MCLVPYLDVSGIVWPLIPNLCVRGQEENGLVIELTAAVKGACTYPNIVNGEIVDRLCPKDPLGDVASSRVGVGVGTA